MYRPWTGRRFGVEIELITRTTNGGRLRESDMREAIEGALDHLGLPESRLRERDSGYWHSDGTTWDVKTDSSCGWEIASPTLRLDNAGECLELREVCKRLQDKGAKVNGTCGLHIHIETPRMSWKQFRRLLRLWARYEPFFFSLVPFSRRDNHYCRPNYSKQWGVMNGDDASNVAAACLTDDEYRLLNDYGPMCSLRGALNLNHYWRSQRIEVRLHQGTVSAVKMEKWAMLTMAMVQRAYRDDLPEIPAPDMTALADGLSVEYICRTLGLLPSPEIPDVPEEAMRLVQWLVQRQRQFGTPGRDSDADDVGYEPVAQRRRPRRARSQSAIPALDEFYPVRRSHCEAVMGLHFSQVFNGMPSGNCAYRQVDGSRYCAYHREDVSNNRLFRVMIPRRSPAPEAATP